MAKQPTIKGIFVKSHIRAVREKKGEEGIKRLKAIFGKSIDFKNNDNVPIKDEVSLIESALDVIYGDSIPPAEKEFEAGKLHFRNFLTTPLAKIIFSLFKKNFKLMMLQSKNIAGHVFMNVGFSAEDLGPKSVQVIMENNDYPIDHFKGLFQEWMEFSGFKGKVSAKKIEGRFEYTMIWE